MVGPSYYLSGALVTTPEWLGLGDDLDGKTFVIDEGTLVRPVRAGTVTYEGFVHNASLSTVYSGFGEARHRRRPNGVLCAKSDRWDGAAKKEGCLVEEAQDLRDLVYSM